MRKLIILAALALAPVASHQVKASPYAWYDRSELRCLADNIYYETRNQDFYGQALVAKVTLNRSQKMNESICKTVYKPSQFSWTLKKQKPVNRTGPEYKTAIHAAHHAQLMSDPIYYFHTPQVKPFWAKVKPKAFHYGNHVFYYELA